MQRRQPANLGALKAVGSLSGNAVDVVVISADEALLTTLQAATGAEHALWHAPSADAAVDLLVGGHCDILIADMQVLRSDAAALLERLQAQFPELVLLATGRRDEEHPISGLISKGSVYRFLHKPVSPARASVFLATATRRYHELAKTASPAFVTVKHFAAPTNRLPLIGGVAASVLVALAAIWYLQRQDSAPAGVAQRQTAPAAAQSAQPASVVPDELAGAQRAFKAGRLSQPTDDNALDRYRSVLRVEADNAAALAGVREVLDALETQVTQALQARDAPGAVRALAILQKAQPDHPQLATLREQLLMLSRSARPPESAVVEKTAPDRKATPVAATPNTDLARVRIAAGQLVEPENDSALSYLRKARERGEDESANRILATDIGTRLLARTRKAIAADDTQLAQTELAAAIAVDREFQLALPELAVVGRNVEGLLAASSRVTNGRGLAEQLAPVITLRESGQLIAPAGSSAFDLLQALAAQNPDAPEVRAEQQRLASTLLDHARTALAQGNLEQVELLASRIDELAPRMPSTRVLRDQISAARQQREAATRVMQAAELKRTREVAAIYPQEAERRGTEGWVDVEFTIAPDGTTQDHVVHNSQPSDVFDKAAVDALRKWRFEPIVRNGKTVSQRAVLRVRFTLK